MIFHYASNMGLDSMIVGFVVEYSAVAEPPNLLE